jgi:hypothetical protein
MKIGLKALSPGQALGTCDWSVMFPWQNHQSAAIHAGGPWHTRRLYSPSKSSDCSTIWGVLFPPCDQPICPLYQTVYMMEGPWPPDLWILTDECVFLSVCCIVVIVHCPKTAKAWTPMSVGSAPSSKALRLELGFLNTSEGQQDSIGWCFYLMHHYDLFLDKCLLSDLICSAHVTLVANEKLKLPQLIPILGPLVP